MSKEVFMCSGEPRVSTTSLFIELGYTDHRQLKEVINRNKAAFLNLGGLEQSKGGIPSDLGGRPPESYLLNLRQFVLLMSLIKNTPATQDLKVQVISRVLEGLMSDTLFDLTQKISFLDVDPECSDLFVYVVKESISGRYKVGISKDPHRRVRTLNTGNPEKLILVHAYLATEGFNSEKAAHDLFKDHRLEGEWFEHVDLKLLPSYTSQLEQQ